MATATNLEVYIRDFDPLNKSVTNPCTFGDVTKL